MTRSLIIALAMLVASGCASVDVADYRSESPPLDLARYFNGTVDGWGMFQDRSGRVVKRFRVRIDATWSGEHRNARRAFRILRWRVGEPRLDTGEGCRPLHRHRG